MNTRKSSGNYNPKVGILKRAAEYVATGQSPYTCWAVGRVSKSTREWYWLTLIALGAETNGMLVNFASNLWAKYEGRQERLMFMAWLITMVEEGEIK
jgi:hypothetical protein